jgi:hypothetical protein
MHRLGPGRPSYGHDFDKIVDPSEVVRVTRIEGQLDGTSGRGYEEIDCSRASSFPTKAGDRRVDSTVGARGVTIEQQWVKRSFGALEAILPTASLIGIVGRVWACCELSERDGADRYLEGQGHGVESFEINENGSVDNAPRWADLVSHAESDLGSSHGRDPHGIVRSRR